MGGMWVLVIGGVAIAVVTVLIVLSFLRMARDPEARTLEQAISAPRQAPPWRRLSSLWA
jgi:hypothetical protein